MNSANSPLFGRNLFAKAFQEFDEDSFFASLHNRIKDKSYYEKYRGFKNTVLALSYFFNAASILTASYAIFWLTEWLTGLVWLSWLTGAVFLFFLESIKRKSSNEFFQVWFFQKQIAVGWMALSLFCFAISLTSSAFGTKSGTNELAPSAELVAADSVASAYRAEIAKLDAENKLLQSQRNHEGTIYYKLQGTIAKNKGMIGDYNQRILELDKKLEGKNDLLSGKHRSKVERTGWILVVLTLLMELLFESCIAYIWYYFYRSYVERRKLKGIPEKETGSLPHPMPDQEQLLQLFHQFQQDLLAKDAERQSFPPGFEQFPPTNGNGTMPENRTHRTIGFKTTISENEPSAKREQDKSSVQACTSLYTENPVLFSDRYTVPHTYHRHGKPITVHYTLPQIESRVAQYEREVGECQTRNLSKEILHNRQTWLRYWEGKKRELENKLELAKEAA